MDCQNYPSLTKPNKAHVISNLVVIYLLPKYSHKQPFPFVSKFSWLERHFLFLIAERKKEKKTKIVKVENMVGWSLNFGIY